MYGNYNVWTRLWECVWALWRVNACCIIIVARKMSDGTRVKNALALCFGAMIYHGGSHHSARTPISLLLVQERALHQNTTCPLCQCRFSQIETERKSVSAPVDLKTTQAAPNQCENLPLYQHLSTRKLSQTHTPLILIYIPSTALSTDAYFAN